MGRGFVLFVVLFLAGLSVSVPARPAADEPEEKAEDTQLSAGQLEALEKKAKKGNADAQWKVARHYYRRFLQDQNPDTLRKTVPYLRDAVEQGHAPSKTLLDRIYNRGRTEFYGLRPGDQVAERSHVLEVMEATIDRDGDIARKRDVEKGLELLKAAAASGSGKAMFDLWRIYAGGRDVKRDSKKAFSYLKAAAEQGHAEAQWKMGMRYVQGRDVPQDSKEAVKWFRKAADNGLPEGMTSLGVMYATGDGVEKDFKKAFELYQKAANLGSSRAMKNLAVMYYLGQYVEKDLVEAKKWTDIAVELGDEEADRLALIIDRELTDEQRAEGRKRADAWLKAHPQE